MEPKFIQNVIGLNGAATDVKEGGTQLGYSDKGTVVVFCSDGTQIGVALTQTAQDSNLYTGTIINSTSVEFNIGDNVSFRFP